MKLSGCVQPKLDRYEERKTSTGAKIAGELRSCLVFCSNDLKRTPNLTIEPLVPARQSYFYFFKHHKCYDLLPGSTKLVVLDTKLSVKKSFYALIFNNVRAAVLWSSARQSYVGMLTITDFIRVLVNGYGTSCGQMEDFESSTVSQWRSCNERTRCHRLISVSPEDPLLDAADTLIKHRFHRLPVIDPIYGNPLHILTHKRILKYLYLNRRNLPQETFMSCTLEELNLGTYAPNVHVLPMDASIISALHLFLKHRVSCIPIVDTDNRLVELYAKFDVFNLAVTRTYNDLDITVYDALAFHRSNRQRYPSPMTCSKKTTLKAVIERVVLTEVHRLIMVDEDQHIDGIISLSDILKFLISLPPADDESSGMESRG
ncbi:unnamed protein product [Calicophoron daubneyi]|uniref:CBS domain-containing protein n=1 Tax=Calicophoron daubneyi TaxID=300641 RepID=A0AAV2T7G4_CALDB